MKYQLIKENNPEYSAAEQILINRGIPYNQINHYLHTTDDDINSPLFFGQEKLAAAAQILEQTIKESADAALIIDCDYDGFGSAALLTNYLHDYDPDWINNHLTYFFHSGKQHGLDDHIDTLLKNQYKLILVPDAGSNDIDSCEKLSNQGKQIIILDHHICENENPYAIVINTENSDYPNKALCGCGVTWQFCRYLDEIHNLNYADKYIDLVAITLISDMMDIRSIETRHLITKGLRNLENPFIITMKEKNSYSIGNELTPINAAFYIVPFVNCVMRSGTQEEKKLLFSSMLNFEAYKNVSSTKRGHKTGDTEVLVEQAVRVATNVKARQTKIQNLTVDKLEALIHDRNLLNHKVLLFLLEPGEINKNIAGLCANKIMSEYQRPVCVLTKTIDNNIISYQGSMRGCAKAGISDFKAICEKTGDVSYVVGHQNAAGISIPEDKIQSFIFKTDTILSNISSEPIYYVDYIYYQDDIEPQKILEIANLDDLWGQDLDESLIALKDVKITQDMVTIYTKRSITIKITLSNGISIMLFNAEEEDVSRLKDNNDGYVVLNIVGKCNANEWGGSITPQIFITDYEIIDSNKYYF